MKIVIAVLTLLFGLKFLSSILLSSILSMRVDGWDYRWLPGIGLLVFATAVCITRILADSRSREREERKVERHEKLRRPDPDDDVAGRRSRENDWRQMP